VTTPATPSAPKPAGGPPKPGAPGESPAAIPPDVQLLSFWEKNGHAILVLCGIVLVFYIGKGAWDYYAAQKEAGIEAEFAAAATPEKMVALSL